jgi:hypothetical protein
MANIELDGANKKIKVDSGDLTLDIPGDIILDADGGDITFADGGTNILKVTNSSSDVVLQPQVDAKDIIFKQYDGTTVATVEDNGTFNIPTDKLAINGTAVTSTAAELNILDGVTATATELNLIDGVTATTAELNILDGVTATASEINLIDGGTARGTTAIADGDGVLINDAGTMRMTTVETLKTYIGGADPSSADGDSLGTASLEWSDLYLADGGIIYFGNDQDVTLTHVADTGLTFKTAATASDSYPTLNIHTGSTDIDDNDYIGRIDFRAPDEGTGTDAITAAAAIYARAEADFSSSVNKTKLVFQTGSSGAASDKLTITNNGSISLTPDASSAWVWNENGVDADFRVESDEKSHLFFLDGGTNDGASAFNDDAPETGTGGVTLNQTSLDNLILSLKSNDIAHGVTNHQETDTYMGFLKYHATSGGGNITGISEDDVGMFIHGFAPNGQTSQDASAVACVQMRANAISGAGGANVGSTANCFGVQNAGSQRFIVRGDGNIFSDQGHSTYDDYDDAQLARAYDLSHGKGVIDSKFDKFVAYNHEKLAELDLVGRHPKTNKPNHMVNVTGMQRLHNGAIWQQYEKHNQLLEAVYDLAKEAVGEEKANAILEKHEVKRLQ